MNLTWELLKLPNQNRVEAAANKCSVISWSPDLTGAHSEAFINIFEISICPRSNCWTTLYIRDQQTDVFRNVQHLIRTSIQLVLVFVRRSPICIIPFHSLLFHFEEKCFQLRNNNPLFLLIIFRDTALKNV